MQLLPGWINDETPHEDGQRFTLCWDTTTQGYLILHVLVSLSTCHSFNILLSITQFLWAGHKIIHDSLSQVYIIQFTHTAPSTNHSLHVCVCVCGGFWCLQQWMPAPDTGLVMSTWQSRMPATVIGGDRVLGPTAMSQIHHTNPNYLPPI